ncbi:MAG: hypothetical protein RL172_589 [Bacteroidota bacterium]
MVWLLEYISKAQCIYLPLNVLYMNMLPPGPKTSPEVLPKINPESDPDRIPEWPDKPAEDDPEIVIPNEDPYQNPPYEIPEPGEGP